MEQIPLPTKTKIAGWWIKILGIAAMVSILVYGVYSYLTMGHYEGGGMWALSMIALGIPIFFGGLIVFHLSNSILKRERGAWWVSIILFLIGTISCIGGSIFYFLKVFYFLTECYALKTTVFGGSCVARVFAVYGNSILIGVVFLPILLVPLILLLLDRKNF